MQQAAAFGTLHVTIVEAVDLREQKSSCTVTGVIAPGGKPLKTPVEVGVRLCACACAFACELHVCATST